ncbi:MAG: DUF4157 domain-containing protein [Bacteroidia bacterium]
MSRKAIHRKEEQPQTYIQPALEVGKEDDDHEKEANSVADKIMRMPESGQEKQKMSTGKRKVQPMFNPTADKTGTMNTGKRVVQKMSTGKSGLKATPNVEQGIHSTKGNGQSLQPELQQEMGSKIGADFSDVNVHTDNNAAEMNQEIGAKAFTHGKDIYFNKGQYDPASDTGKHLLAHELTHTVQQDGNENTIQRKLEQKDMAVTDGSFGIDMKPGTKSRGAVQYYGDESQLWFTPNKTTQDSANIDLIQIVRLTKESETSEKDYKWPKSASDRNKIKTEETTIKYTTVEKDTLKSISFSNPNGELDPIDIYRLNKDKLGKTFDPLAEIKTGTELLIPQVQEGYFIDHDTDIADKRKSGTDKETTLLFREYFLNKIYNSEKKTFDGTKKVKEGFKKTTDAGTSKEKVESGPAYIIDFPSVTDTGVSHFYFETVARSIDLGIDYGTIYWGFKIDNQVVSDEYAYVKNGSSATFKSAVAGFNKLYRNHHAVVKGDTLESISISYYGDESKVEDIKKANNLTSTTLTPGTMLILPKITK